MAFTQSIDLALASRIGGAGVPQTALEAALSAVETGMARLRQEGESGRLPLLSMPAETGDLAEIREAGERIARQASDVVFLGTGALALGVATARAAGKAARIQGKVARGVSVAGIDLSGLTPDEAEQKVRAWARERVTTTPITLVAPQSGRKWNIPLAEAGGRFLVEEAIDKAAAVGKDDSWFQRLWIAWLLWI